MLCEDAPVAMCTGVDRLGLPSPRLSPDIQVSLKSYHLSLYMLPVTFPKPTFLPEVSKKGFGTNDEIKVNPQSPALQEGHLWGRHTQGASASVVEVGSLLREFVNLDAGP